MTCACLAGVETVRDGAPVLTDASTAGVAQSRVVPYFHAQALTARAWRPAMLSAADLTPVTSIVLSLC
jgi:hypothetical protein